jgi:hypothetical protein
MTIWSGARDGYDAYFAEKLWDLIPGLYKELDGLADDPGVLRALVEVVAEQAAHLRRSHDRLWEDQQIEQCADWAVSYIGALVATRILPAQTRRGRRIDVAKTIYYRRRKGTPAILEQLASDIAGWEGVVSEGFRRLIRTPHHLDAPRDALRWKGTADLRVPLLTERAGGPFDVLQHTPDVRKPHGHDGRYGISRLSMHLYRLRSTRLRGVRPRPIPAASDAYTFDPSGRDVPLFARRGRVTAAGDPLDWDGWRPAEPWDVPAPIPCRLLEQEAFEIQEAHLLNLIDDGVLLEAVAEQLRVLRGRRLEGVTELRLALLSRPDAPTLTSAAVVDAIRARTLVEDCGRARLLGHSLRVELDGAPAETRERTSAGTLADWNDPRPERGLVIDPQRGRFRFIEPPPDGLLTVDYHVGVADSIGAGGFARTEPQPADLDRFVDQGLAITDAHLPAEGWLCILDSATYGQPADRADIVAMAIHAAPQQRPYVRLTGDWRLSAADAGDATLLIDGIWVGADAPASLILAGDWEEVRLVNVTLDPGGPVTADTGADLLDPVRLVVTDRVERLIVERSLLGPVLTEGDGTFETISITDSIVQARTGDALNAPEADLTTERATLLGDLVGRTLHASQTLIDGRPLPRNSQSGCFRFSAAREGGTPPEPYRSYFFEPGAGFFRSRRFGDPGFARLRESAPHGLRTGAEAGGEIGAYAGLMEQARAEGLRRKVEEYMPFGLLPVFVYET